MLLASAAAGCGSDPVNNTPAGDAAVTTDTSTTDTPTTDTATADVRDAAADVRVDAAQADVPPSRAGAACTMPDPMGGMDPACGDDMVCIPTQSSPMCTNPDGCEDNPSQAMERSQCGGTGSTCLTQGDPPSANSICTASCRVAALTVSAGACRPGFVCTGWWYTHMGAVADATGCFGFCSENAHCGTGRMCNARTGACGTTGTDMTRLADGMPCNPMMTVTPPGETRPRNVQCRGICFALSSADRTRGMCGSFINARATTSCPDEPDSITPLARATTDNLAICLFRSCRTNGDCASPLICRYPEDAMGAPQTMLPTSCDYPTTMQRTGIPATMGDGGTTTDGGRADAVVPVDVAVDVPATDIAVGG